MVNGLKIIAIVGMPGSGKGTLADTLENRGYPVVHFGAMVYEEVEKRGLDIVKDETFVRHDMRRIDGPAVLAKRVDTKIQSLIENDKKTILLDGLYTWTEYRYLVNKYNNHFMVIAVVAPKALRHKRAISRHDGKRKYTIASLLKREIDEIENMEKGGPIAYADYYINNDGDIHQFAQKIDKICQTIGI